MARRIVYGISLWAFLFSAACTIAAIAMPNWVTYTSPSSTPDNSSPIRVSYGLHKRCSSITGHCTPFPQNDDCTGDGRYFCSIWKSAAFLMNFAIVLDLACLFGYVVILSGGRNARDAGWKILAALLALVAAAQLVAMALVAYLYDNDNRFFVGWELDKSWVLCTVSWSVLVFNALGVIAGAALLERDDDYEPIDDR